MTRAATGNERLWDVTVQCYSENGLHVARFLLAAPNSDAAFHEATRVAENTAPIGPKWTDFVVRRVASVQLPYSLPAVWP